MAKTPPTCKYCRAPIYWAHREDGTGAVPVDGAGLSDDERVVLSYGNKPRFDDASMTRHECPPREAAAARPRPTWMDEVARHIDAAFVEVGDHISFHGGLLRAVGADYLVVEGVRGHVIIPAERVYFVRVKDEAPFTASTT